MPCVAPCLRALPNLPGVVHAVAPLSFAYLESLILGRCVSPRWFLTALWFRLDRIKGRTSKKPSRAREGHARTRLPQVKQKQKEREEEEEEEEEGWHPPPASVAAEAAEVTCTTAQHPRSPLIHPT